MNIRQEREERQFGIDWRTADEVSVGSVHWRDRPEGRSKHGVVLRLCHGDREEGLRITVSRARARQIAIALAQASGMSFANIGPLKPVPQRISRLIADRAANLSSNAGDAA